MRFQHTAARRRLGIYRHSVRCLLVFQHTAARRRLVTSVKTKIESSGFQHTAARRRLAIVEVLAFDLSVVSTHSRPKAAGSCHRSAFQFHIGFNTQPPEGGWVLNRLVAMVDDGFQHTAARRRLGLERRQANGSSSFNTQPPEGGWLIRLIPVFSSNGFNTQPPEGGWR